MNRARILKLLSTLLRSTTYGLCIAVALVANFWPLFFVPALLDVACWLEQEYKLYD